MKKIFQDGNLDKGDSLAIPDASLSSSEKAFHYLFAYQNRDGGWGASQGDASTILLTAMAFISLKQCPEIPQKAMAVNKAVEYLLSGQHEDGGFGDRVSTVKETALVLNALNGISGEINVLERAKDFISSAQSKNGSWDDDLYSTVLAIEAVGISIDPDRQGQPAETPSLKDEYKAADKSRPAPASPRSVSDEQSAATHAGMSSNAGETAPVKKGEAGQRTQQTKISLVSRRKASSSAVEGSSDPPAGRDVLVQSVNTDKKKYLSNETVHIYSTIDNRSDISRSIIVNAQVADSYGHVAGAASHDMNPSVNLETGACEPVTLSWYTGMNPPGSYTVRFHVADAADGRILDEKKITFSIMPAIVIEDLIISANPAYCIANEAATVELKIAFQNRSNTDAPLKAELIVKDPDGNTVHQDSVRFEIPVSVPNAAMELNPINHNFKKCGRYIIETAIKSGNTVCSRALSTIHVNPAIRIEATRSLDPSIVTPDGDKAIQVGIRLEGVGMTANPSIVHAQTNTVGDLIYITCDKAMADPTGNKSGFIISADKLPIRVRDICLDIPDITTFKLTLETPVTEGQEIYISCSSEDLACVEGKPLIAFYDERVKNRVSPPIFNQDGYGFSGPIPPKPLAAKTVMTGYSQWPAGFRKGNLAFTGAVFDGQCIWMVPANAHSIVKIDKNTGEMTAYGEWPAGFRKGNLAFTGAVFDGRYIWLVPANADSVIRVDTKNGSMTAYNRWPEGFSKGGHAFAGGVFDGRSIWMIPSYSESVVKIDTVNGSMTAYNRWPEGFAKGGYAFAGGVFDGRSIWMIPANADSIVALDTLTGEMKRYNAWPEGHSMVEYAFAGGVFDGRSIWMIPYYSGQVIRVDSRTGEMSGHHPRPEELGKGEYAFAGAVFDGQAIWMVPLNADRVIKIDKDTLEARELHDWPQGFHKGVNAFAGGVFDGDCIWMIPSYADRVLKISSYSSMSISANITSNDSFYLYVSQNETEEGALVGKGQGWASVHSVNTSLVPGVTNYLHVKCIDNKGPVAAFIADFTLNDPNFHFTDGTQKIVTSEDYWRVYLDKFGGPLGSVVSIGKNGLGSWSTRFGIDLDANWIWTSRGSDKGTRYFSTPIYYSAVPIEPMEDIHVTSSIGGPDVAVDETSFTRKPSRLKRNGDVIIAEWDLMSFRVGQREDVFLNVTMLNPVPSEERVISDSLKITYRDAAGLALDREFGPCHVHVLSSSFISSIELDDNVFTAGDNVNIGCSFKNVSNSEKMARLTAVIEDADGSIIQQVSRKDIQFPPGEDKRMEGIALNLTSAIPGRHRACVILSDSRGGQLAQASADFVVENGRASRPVKDPGQDKGTLKGDYTAIHDREKVDLTNNRYTSRFEATIMAQPSPIYQGLSETIYYKISSKEGEDLTGLKVEIAILTVNSREKRQSLTPPAPQVTDGSPSGTFTFSTGKLEPGQYLACLLVSSDAMAGPEEIASTHFAVRTIDLVAT